MDKERIIGIYKITCTGNNEFYIGSSLNVDERIYQHRCDLKHNRHHSTFMQRSYNKYGAESFVFDIIAEFKECTDELLREIEYLYIIKLKPAFNYAAPSICTKNTEQWRRKISESTKRLYTEKGYTNPRLGIGKRYDVYDYMGNKVAEHKTITEAAACVKIVSYHTLNNDIRNRGIVITKSLYAIIPEGQDLIQKLLDNSDLLETKPVVELNGNIYKNPVTMYYKKGKRGPKGYKAILFSDIRNKILSSENKYFIIDNRVFTMPFLCRFIEKSIPNNTWISSEAKS